MPSGQVQSRFKNEKALDPEAIEDVQKLLDETAPGYKVKNHKTISGLTFFEMEHMKWEMLVLVPEVWCFLVVGEDPNNAEGCIAAMRLATRNGVRNGKAITTHGSRLNDTRGGIPIVAWCSALQFKRTYTRGGKLTRSYTALQKVRVRYCRRLLELFAAQDSFKDQDWQIVQNIVDEYQDLLHLDGIPRRPDDGYRLRNVRQAPPNHGNNANNANNAQDQNQNPGPGNADDSDASDDNDDYHQVSHRTATSSFSRSASGLTEPEYNDNLSDFDQDLDVIKGPPDVDDDIADDNDEDPMDFYDDPPPSPLFVSRSRSVTTEPTTTTTTRPEYDDEDSDMDIKPSMTFTSRFRFKFRDTSSESKTAAAPTLNRLGSRVNPFDMTEDSDDEDDHDDVEMIITDCEIKADPTEESDVVQGRLEVVQVERGVIEMDSDVVEDDSSIIEDDPDVIIIEPVVQVIEIDD